MIGDSRDVSRPPDALAPSGVRDERRTVLLVEDDAGDALIVEELLAIAWPQLEVRHAASIAAAELILAEPVDCVVLDLGLPDAQGLDALARVVDAAPETAVVVLTGHVDKRRGNDAVGAGAQDYMVKSEMTGEGLARAIGYSIQRKHSERTARELAVLRVQSSMNARVQRGLVPHPLLDHQRMAVRSRYQPGNRRQVLGGDFFDVVQTAPDCVHVVLGDVCGRGPDEAALGVQLRIAWRVLTLADTDQPKLLSILDKLIVKERHAEHIFATLAGIRLNPITGEAEVAVAGHPPPILVNEGGVQLLVDHTGGPPLGLIEDARWEMTEVQLGPDWTLLFYSDGIYEGYIGEDRARLGLDGFVELLSERHSHGSLWDELPDGVISRVEALNGGPLDDDVALLALRLDADTSI